MVAVTGVVAAIEWGNDSSPYALDGECDDPRFGGPGMADVVYASNELRDATDCRDTARGGASLVKLPVIRATVVLLAVLLAAGCASRTGSWSLREAQNSLRTSDLLEIEEALESLESSNYRRYSPPTGVGNVNHPEHDREAVRKWTREVDTAWDVMEDWMRRNHGIACQRDVDAARRAAARDEFAKANNVDNRELYDELCSKSITPEAILQRYRESNDGSERMTFHSMGLYLVHWRRAISSAEKAALENHKRYRVVTDHVNGVNLPLLRQFPPGKNVLEAEAEARAALADARRFRGDPDASERAQQEAEGRPVTLPPSPFADAPSAPAALPAKKKK